MRRILAFLSLMGAALTAAAQQDYRYTVDTNPMLSGINPANYNRLDVKRTSIAEIDCFKKNGELMSLEESPNSIEAGIATESYAKISDRIAFYGKLSYSYFNGLKMGGQILMNPRYNPVQFLESSDTTTGVKQRELYHLTGGMTYTFNPKWSAGIKIDYEAGDQSKLKDPRFLNYWMNLGLVAGFTFNPSERWSIGFSVKYRNTQEQINGGVYGTTDKQYNVLTDKGAFWGTSELLDGDYAYVPGSSTKRPMMNNFIGGAVQFVYNGDFEFFNEISFDMRTGYYGKRISSSPVFFEFSGMNVTYNGAVLIRRGQNLHKIRIDAEYGSLTNNENQFEYNTPEGKSTEVVYKGQTKTADIADIDAAFGYDLFLDTEHYRPSLKISANASLDLRTIGAIAYPFFRNSTTARYRIDAGVEKTFFCGKNLYSIGGGLEFISGFGTPKEDGTYAQGATLKLKSFDNYLNRQFEFDTASRAGAALEFTYTRLFSTKVAGYVTIRDEFCSLFGKAQYLNGMTRNVARLCIGCKF